VPSVWIGGEYIGGCDDGPDPVGAPGLVPLAFRDKLFEKLQSAGAFKADKAARTGTVNMIDQGQLPPEDEEQEAGPWVSVQKAFEIFQKSQAEGMSFKQSVADAIAGEYDIEATTADVKSLAASAPLVLFTWESSPACKKAIKLLAETGVQPKMIRLDDPWSEGNPRRAALGRLTGQSSVPSVWIGGEYVGGCDDGPDSVDAPGLIPLAFRGKLFEKLESAGAFEADKAPRTGTVTMLDQGEEQEIGPLASVQKAFEIFQKSRAEGLSFKQSVADAIAGEYDIEATTAEVKSLAASAPLVLFTWETCPSCKKAIELIAETGAKPKIIRLDDPSSEGNPRKAVLGRLTGQSSVPSIWVGGEYIGGCNDGPDPINAPGLVPLAFRGKLFEKLEAAGALEAGNATQG